MNRYGYGYKGLEDTLNSRINQIETALERLGDAAVEARERVPEMDWGEAGDLGHLGEKLEELVEFWCGEDEEG